MDFDNLIIEAADAERKQVDKTWQVSYRLRVVDGPAGGMTPEQAVPVSYTSRPIADAMAELEHGGLKRTDLITFGRTLAALLLPHSDGPAIPYDLFVRALERAGPDGGLRLRLRLPPLLAALPWEYLYVDRVGNPDSIDGFLALNPHVAIIRDEVLPTPSTLAPLAGPIKLVVALASPEGYEPLDLDKEVANLHRVLDELPGLEATYLQAAALDDVRESLPGAGIFHFAGHGAFDRERTDAPGIYSGTGAIVLDDTIVDATQLAVTLSAGGVRLAFLGGCLTGRREGISVWSGIAPALIRAQAQVPAVVANQFSIKDTSAIAFSKAFYQALVGGLSIEEAVAHGRIAVYNADKQGADWGVPVLYLRPGDGHLFTGASDTAVREAARAESEVIGRARAGNVARGGYVGGVEMDSLRNGGVIGDVKVGDVDGEAIAVRVNDYRGGAIKGSARAGKVKQCGRVIGVQIGGAASGGKPPEKRDEG